MQETTGYITKKTFTTVAAIDTRSNKIKSSSTLVKM